MLKQCTKCKISKDSNQFWSSKNMKDRLRSSCKKCHKKYYNLPTIKERKRVYDKKYRKEHEKEMKKYQLENQKLPHIKKRKKKYDKKYRKEHEKERNKERSSIEYKNHVKHIRLKKLYNITLLQYNKMVEQQDNKCAICGEPETVLLKGILKELSVDHNHKTKKIRGLLCGKCNNALGLFNDDIFLMLKALNYVFIHKSIPGNT